MFSKKKNRFQSLTAPVAYVLRNIVHISVYPRVLFSTRVLQVTKQIVGFRVSQKTNLFFLLRSKRSQSVLLV